MSHHHPTLPMPGGQKLETLLVCADARCGKCVRCDYLAKSKDLVIDLIAAQMANEALDQIIKDWQALAHLRGNCLETIAHSIGDIKAQTALLELVEMTPEAAFKALTERGPNGEDAEGPAPDPAPPVEVPAKHREGFLPD